MGIAMEPVTISSTAIQQVQYHEKKKELDVLFTDGTFSSYKNVPEKVYKELISTESVGYYFNTEIRGKYAFS